MQNQLAPTDGFSEKALSSVWSGNIALFAKRPLPAMLESAAEQGLFLLPAGRLSYPHLAQPGTVGDGSDGLKYRARVILRGDAELQGAVDKLYEAWNKKQATAKQQFFDMIQFDRGFDFPFLSNAAIDRAGHEDKTGHYINLKSPPDSPPTLVDWTTGAMLAVPPEEVTRVFYSGCWVVAVVAPYAWLPSSATKGGKGVAFGFSGLYKIADDESLGGGPRISMAAATKLASPEDYAAFMQRSAPTPQPARQAPQAAPGAPGGAPVTNPFTGQPYTPGQPQQAAEPQPVRQGMGNLFSQLR